MKKFYCLLIASLLITGCSCSKKEEKKENNKDKNNTVINDSKIDEIIIQDFIVLYENNISTIYFDVVNTSEETKNYDKLICELYDKDGSLVYTLENQVGTLDPASTKSVKLDISMDLREASSMECSKG